MIWQQLSEEDREGLLKLGTSYKHKRGTQIFADTPKQYIYILQEGLVGIYENSTHDQLMLHITFSPGEIFPVDLLMQTPRSSMATAETEVKVLRLDFEVFSNFFKRDVSLMEILMSEIAGYYVNYSYQVSGLELQYARDRLVYKLLYLASQFSSGADKQVVIPRLSRMSMAQSTNLSKEKVSREMRRLVNLDLVAYAPRKIIIKNIEGLRDQLGRSTDIPRA